MRMDGQEDGDTTTQSTAQLEPSDTENADQSVQQATKGTSDASVAVKLAVDRTLSFLSNASNETLGACLVGLGATTYLVLGRVGLIIIGAVGGVVLHATWEGSNQGEDQNSAGGNNKRKETNSQIALRLLQWREARQTKPSGDDSESAEDEATEATDFADFQPQTGKALNVLTDAVIRDYVRWWYSPVLPTEDIFPATCRQTFTSFLLGLSSNLSKKRPADSFLEFVTNSSSVMIVFLNELSTALSTSPTVPPADAIQTYLEKKPESSLANILDESQQHRKLQMVATDILQKYLDGKVLDCPPARVFLREILANVILDFTLQRCCKAEWINDWIVYLLEDGEPELLNAIDAGVDESSVQQAVAPKLEANATGPELGSVVEKENSDAQAHKRQVSKAEEAMEEAMREAQRLTQLIAEEEAKRVKESGETLVDDTSDSTNTHGIQTPESSQSDLPRGGLQEAAPIESKTDLVGDDGASSVIPAAEIRTSTDMSQSASPHHTTASIDEPVSPQKQPEPLTLHKANFTIFDDATPNDKRPLKTKPTTDYMVQIEPLSSSFGGWMIARTYTDFETLHEVLRRISAISGATRFAEAHTQLPQWRGSTKPQLTSELERYLTDAVQFESLAESEGMKRFLEKSRGMSKSPGSKNPFWAGQAAIENVGKGMFDVLSKAPKGVAGGGKAVLGGVSSVLGGVQSGLRSVQSPAASIAPTSSTTDLERPSTSRESQDLSNSSVTSLSTADQVQSSRSSASFSEKAEEPEPSEPSQPETPQISLPPPPSEIPDDYHSAPGEALPQTEQPEPSTPSIDNTPVLGARDVPDTPVEQSPVAPPKKRVNKVKAPISTQETQVTIELLFATINELYGLSSAWNIRRTLLNAAKSYLLRPANPQLENIRVLLQDSVLDANTSDSGMAAHILKLRENSLPTEEELKAWPAPLDDKEKEALRKKARKLLVERGMPQALMSVMGAAASGEALGRLFDCLQVEQVARGLLFGFMLQAVRAATQ